MEWEIDEGPLLQWAGAALGGARLRLVCVLRAHPKSDHVVEEVFTGYIRQLSQYCPAAAQQEVVNPHIVAASAGWMALILKELPKYLDADQQRGPFTYRQSMLYCLDTFFALAHRYGCFLALAQSVATLSVRLKTRWACRRQEIPLCAAFQRGAP